MFEIMKKTLFFLFAAAAVISAASCQKIESTSAFTPMTLTASFDNVTRTAIDGFSVTWSDGDKIVVIDETGDIDTFTLSAGAGTKNGTFTQDNDEVLEGQLYAVYGTTNAGLVEENKLVFKIPASQDGSFSSANICVAKASDGNLAFKNATAIVKVVGSDNPHYFEISCSSGRCTGSMFAEFSGNDVVVTANTFDEDGASKSIHIGTQCTANARIDRFDPFNSTYYFAVAPNSYSYKAEKYTWNGGGNKVTEVSTKSSSDTKSLERNKIYTVTPSF